MLAIFGRMTHKLPVTAIRLREWGVVEPLKLAVALDPENVLNLEDV